MIPRRDHHVPATRAGAAAQKAVVELQRTVAGCAVVEDITGNEQSLDPFVLDAAEQPVKKAFEFFVALAAVERTADVPI